MSTDSSGTGPWAALAATWRLVGPPLRPVAEDLELVRAALDGWDQEASRPPRVLILGVTPELFDLPWPAGSLVHAADRTEQMISLVWPGEQANAIQADWRDMPWLDASFDLVVCDGGWHLLDLAGQQVLADVLARIIAPGGRFVVRLFVPSAQRQTPGQVIADLMSGRIRDLNALKLRLGPALMPSAKEGVALADIWQYLRDATGEWNALAARLGWDPKQLGAIDAYRDSVASYHFVRLEEFEAMMRSTSTEFSIDAVGVPSYAMGDQCPTVVVRKAR